MDKTFVMGVVGIGGFAKAMTDLVLEVGDQVDPPVRLEAVCDPAAGAHAARVQALREAGVKVLDSIEQLLEIDEIEGVWLPAPIHLHRPFMEKALAAGKAVLCEKPAAGTVDDVDAMIAARDRSRLTAIIGFQDIYDPMALRLKRRLLAGDLGRVRRAWLWSCTPRPGSYFQRNDWAGRLKRGDTWVLDSPTQNAISHAVNLALYLLGADEANSATAVEVEAELYRAAAIENYDTASFRASLAEDPQLLVLQTHAAGKNASSGVRIEGEKGTATWGGGQVELNTPAGQERMERGPAFRGRLVQQFARLVRGRPDPDVGVATLEVARKHTLLINGISEAAPVRPVPGEHVNPVPMDFAYYGQRGEPASPTQAGTVDDPRVVRAIEGIEAAFEHCGANFQMLHESGKLPFTSAGGRKDLRGYEHFKGPHPGTRVQD